MTDEREKVPEVVCLESKTYLGINAADYLNGSVQLTVEDECEELGQEPAEGNMEYKLKLVNVGAERLQHLITQMNWRLKEGSGEAVYRIGVTDSGHPEGISDQDLRATIKAIQHMADQLSCTVLIVRVAKGPKGKMAQLVVRKSVGDFVNIRLCVVGNVDSGKSTLVGVLTSGKLDDGRGTARRNVFRHRHEFETGRSSSVSQQTMCFDRKGEVAYAQFSNSTVEDLVGDSSKVLTLIDLAGHERYLKTTVFGLTGHVPDYTLVAVAANNGVLPMTRQHIGVAFALNIPVFVVVTKLDLCPENKLAETLEELKQVISAAKVQASARVVSSMEDVAPCANQLASREVCPIFLCSCLTGQGLELLKTFLHLLPKHKDWGKLAHSRSVFCIDDHFSITGVGTTVSGFMLRGRVHRDEELLLGPTSTGQFVPVRVKSIHIQRLPAKEAVAGQAAAFAIKKLGKVHLRKGMVLVDPSRHPRAVTGFDASVLVLHHDSGIRTNYQPVVHVGTVRQAARITMIQPILPTASDSDTNLSDGGLASARAVPLSASTLSDQTGKAVKLSQSAVLLQPPKPQESGDLTPSSPQSAPSCGYRASDRSLSAQLARTLDIAVTSDDHNGRVRRLSVTSDLSEPSHDVEAITVPEYQDHHLREITKVKTTMPQANGTAVGTAARALLASPPGSTSTSDQDQDHDEDADDDEDQDDDVAFFGGDSDDPPIRPSRSPSPQKTSAKAGNGHSSAFGVNIGLARPRVGSDGRLPKGCSLDSEMDGVVLSSSVPVAKSFGRHAFSSSDEQACMVLPESTQLPPSRNTNTVSPLTLAAVTVSPDRAIPALQLDATLATEQSLKQWLDVSADHQAGTSSSLPVSRALASPAASESALPSQGSDSHLHARRKSGGRRLITSPSGPLKVDERGMAVLGTGQRGLVHFEFCFRPEFVMLGSKFIFRDGRTKGIGRVTKLYHQ